VSTGRSSCREYSRDFESLIPEGLRAFARWCHYLIWPGPIISPLAKTFLSSSRPNNCRSWKKPSTARWLIQGEPALPKRPSFNVAGIVSPYYYEPAGPFRRRRLRFWSASTAANVIFLCSAMLSGKGVVGLQCFMSEFIVHVRHFYWRGVWVSAVTG